MLNKLLLCTIVPAVLSACGGSGNDDATPAVHQLFAQSNNAQNTVLRFTRNDNGTLTARTPVNTNGKGTDGVNYFAGGAAAPDALTSNNSVILNADASQLFVANAGDNTVSVFAIDGRSGELTLLAVSPTGGIRPTSLAWAKGVLYVIHQAGATQLGAYRIGSDGKLAQIGQYPVLQTDALSTEVSISPDGGHVVVNGFLASVSGPMPGNALLSYAINTDGGLAAPVASPSLGVAPFGGRFANGSLNSVYVVAEAAGGTVSSYRYAANGGFTGITGPVAVAGQMAPCWLAITPDNRFVFVSNGSGSVSLFSLDSNGTIAAVNPTAAQEPAVGSNASFAADSWISPDGKYLYQNYAGADKIVSYAIAANGALTKLDERAIGTSSKVSLQGLVGN